MSGTDDAKFLRVVAEILVKSDTNGDRSYLSFGYSLGEIVRHLNELADRCDIVAYPSRTTESEIWDEFNAKVRREDTPDDIVIGYLIAVQLKRLGEKQALGGALAGIGAALGGSMLAQQQKPGKPPAHTTTKRRR